MTNGIHVVMYRFPEVKSVHVSLYTKSGSIMENPKKNGLAHFMEHMLLQGTPSYPTSQEIAFYLEQLAGKYNAFTSELLISFYVTLPYIHAKEAVALASDIWFKSLFPVDALEKERRAVLTEAVQNLDSLEYKLGKFFKEKRFIPDSKLQQFGIGVPETIEKVAIEDIKEFWEEYFTTENTYIVLVGNFVEEEMEALLDEYFGEIKKTTQPEVFTNLSKKDYAEKGVFIRQDPKLLTNYYDIDFPSIDSLAPIEELMTQKLALVILGQLQSSRLIKTLRYDKGLVYGAGAGTAAYPHLGSVSISSEMRDTQFKEVVTIMTDITKEFVTKGPTEQEMKHAKNYLSNQLLMAFDQTSGIANWISTELLWRDKIHMPEDYIAVIKNITHKDIMDLMHNKWDFSKTQIVLQGPQSESKELRDFLEEQLNMLLHLS